ncbi:MAG: TIGR02147 family protein [Proteobacteria bacterium]|nr:MAG: TIGR02147 family protein [Pseudomonadota bacterium]
MAKYEDVGRNEMDLWSRWYHIAILDLSTCEDFQSTPEWIGNRLGLKTEVVAAALDYLKHEGYLTEAEGRLQKAAHHVRLPMTKSKAVIRAFHSRMMNKAAEVMESQTGDAAYANRLISGITVASNPKSLERAKERLSLAAHEVADILSEGPCTEVYHLGFQLFPLTK